MRHCRHPDGARRARRDADARGQGAPARTIASFLGAAAKGELRLGPDTLVVIDEASMLDLPLLYSVLRQMGEGCRLLLVGDPAQLPPIKFGLTFHLLAEQPGVPKVELTEVHRQAAETGIPAVAGAIRRGEMPELPPFSPSMRQGVSFVDCEPGQAAAVITDILSRLGDVGGETRVLAAVRAGPAGVEAINAHLHGLRAPGRARVPGRALAVGDPVMFTRNDYGRELWNGTLVTLVAAGGPQASVAEFDGRRVSLSEADLGDLALAYCLTVHKAQGSQFRRIVMPVFPGLLLDRTLLYTAVTRATEQVVLVGDKPAFATGVRRTPHTANRETALRRLFDFIPRTR
jgi:exodeoxyribonuclease V alpha subunit